MSIQWHHNSNASTDDILDPSHKGPVLVYLANSDDGAGSVWFKIFEDGWTASTNTWGTDRMIAAGGLTTVTIPSDIAPGNYLLRGEVLALHNGYNLDGVQPYVGCVELTISGSGSAKPAGVAFPGAYKDTDPGILCNIYNGLTSYTIPGPALYSSGATSSAGSSASSASSASASSGSASSATPATSATSSSNPSTAAASSSSSGSATSATSAAASSGSSAASGGNLKVQMSGGSSTWWLGLTVSGGSEATSMVEIMDSGSVSSWTELTVMSYAYVFSQSKQLTLPVSVRLTSASGNQVVLSNVFTSWAMTSAIDTGKNYGTASAASSGSSNSSPTAKPSSSGNSNPSSGSSNSAPTTKPSGSSSGSSSASGNVKVTVYSGTNEWWFACTVSGVSSVASVELKDAGTVSSYALMTNNGWAYSLNANGSPFEAPLSVRVTDEAGNAYTAVVSAFTANTVVSAL